MQPLLWSIIAPRFTARSTSNPKHLQKRIKNHISGSIRTSTLRFSLASLLATELGLTGYRDSKGKQKMDDQAEGRLSVWLEKHGKISYCGFEEPWIVEEELLRFGQRLPLNISGSSDPFRIELKSLRRQWGRHDRTY